MQYTSSSECCDTQAKGTYELCGCVSGVSYVQLTVVSATGHNTIWLNAETGETFDTKPVGFVTGTCQEAALNDTFKISATPPTATSPFATPKDGDTVVYSDDLSPENVLAYYRYEADTATWVEIPIVPAGGTTGDMLVKQADGSNLWVTPTPETVTTITDTVNGHTIGIHTNETGSSSSINETITTIIDTVTGHTIAIHTNEAGSNTYINETVCKVENASFDVITGLLRFDFTDENSTVHQQQWIIPVGDKYKTSSGTCLDLVASGNVSLTVGTGLAYTPGQDILVWNGATSHMHGEVVSYNSATGALVMLAKNKEGTGNYCDWVVNLDAIPVVAFTETNTTITNTIAGHLIGTFTNESNIPTAINETVTGFTGLATSGVNIGLFAREDGTTQTLYVPIFKELNRFYVDPNGLDTNTGANEAPKLTVQAAVAALGQGDIAIVNEGVYSGAVTMTLQNTSLAGASGATGSLTNIASLDVTTASGTSNKVSDLTILGAVTHSGGAPLYLHSVTVGGNVTLTSTAYEEVNDCRIQDGTITKTTTGTLYIKDSLIGNATFNTPNSVISLDNVAIDVGDVLTIGPGVIYMLNDVRGTVVIDPAAIPLATALQGAGASAAVAKAGETATFNDVRLTNVPTITTATKALVRDANGVVSEQEFPSFRPKVKVVTADHTLSAADEGYMIYASSATLITITAPAGLPAGFIAEIYQEGAGQVTVVGGAGNTLRSANGFKTRVQHSAIGVSYQTTSLSNVIGDSTV